MQRARDRAAHAERVPVAHHRDALGLGGDGEIERVAAAGGVALGALGAQHAVVVGRARQRGEDLLAADEEAAVDGLGLGAEGRRAGCRRAAFGEGLRVDGAVADDALVVQAAARGCARRAPPRSSPGRRPAPRSTASSTRACSRTARWRRNSGRARRRRGSRCGSWRRAPPSSLGTQMPSRPSPCMSRKFSIGKVASRSCWAARGASTRAPNRRALSISAASSRRRRKAAGSKIGASASRSRSRFMRAAQVAASAPGAGSRG